jgi:hypothetical protein
MDEAERLWARLATTDLVKLNRSLRRAFDVSTLHQLSKSMVDHILTDIVVRAHHTHTPPHRTAGGT